jgi:hypothetical protein
MTMRRVSVLLVAVVLTMMLSVGSALAHQSNNHKVCDVRKGNDVTRSGYTHKQQQRYLNNHPKDYAGKCDNNRGGGFNAGKIGKIAAGPF